ncbi:MAG: hypothetical protein AB7P02_16815 [Alphaproteobacteria bacterium]
MISLGLPQPRSALAAGVLCCGVALAVAVVADALVGWLAAFAFWSSVPVGSLCLVLIMRIVPGAWRSELEGYGDASLFLLPIAAGAAAPVLVGYAGIYSWATERGVGFRGFYLTGWSFWLRTAFFFITSGIAAAMLLGRRGRPTAIAAAGLVAFVLLDTTVAVDWLMSLEPDFHSSGFGLYILSIQATVALSALILAHLALAPPREATGVLGGLLLTALLLWAYFAFMQYFISWSGDLIPNVRWYMRRGQGGWGLAEYAIGTLGLLPALLLLFPPIRRSRRWLLPLGLAVLLGKAIEFGWLVLPVVPASAPVFAVAVLGHAGLGLVSAAVFLRACRRRGAPGYAERPAQP